MVKDEVIGLDDVYCHFFHFEEHVLFELVVLIGKVEV